jgi:hypothetical protein
MEKFMKTNPRLLIILILMGSIFAFSQSKDTDAPSAAPVVGAWDVTVTWQEANYSQQLVFIAMAGGTGSFRILGPRITTQPPVVHPAVWAKPFTGFMSFSGEVEFPRGNCCRETGTLLFKGVQTSNGTINGRAMFVSDISIVATPGAFQTRVGTFTAVPLPVIARSARR